MRGIGSFYTVLCDEDGQEYTLRAQKKLRHQKLTPMVGDRVRFTPGQGEENGWLEEILPRKSLMLRPSVANVDMLPPHSFSTKALLCLARYSSCDMHGV